MIRRYAPNNAALLDIHDGWDVSRAPNGEQYALNTFDYTHHDLGVFSVYRLDWLEALNINMPGFGSPVRVADGVYFSAESYTQDEFMWIMDAFTRRLPNPKVPDGNMRQTWNENTLSTAREHTWAMEVNGFGDVLQAVAPILGMYGVNTSIMEEDGYAIPFYASSAYREALLFLEDLARNNYIFAFSGFRQHYFFPCSFARVGWAPVHTRDLYNLIREAQQGDPNRRFLVTPPEIGINNHRGIGLLQSSSPFNTDGNAWVISSHISDNRLSRLLNMFDAMSFDPELYVLTNYGTYNRSRFFIEMNFSTTDSANFRWSGDPYDSTMYFNRHMIALFREGLFSTGIHDGMTFPRSFLGEFEAVADFAQSAAGMRLNLMPSREDTRGVFAMELAALDAMYWDSLMDDGTVTGRFGIVRQYLANIVRGDVSVIFTWDDYIASLNENGLREYIRLFSQYPRG
jgi:hypothetical protein